MPVMVRCFNLLLVLAMLGLVACSPDSSDSPEKPLFDQRATDGVKEFLGKGYEGYEYYADPRSVTTAMFDLTDLSVVEVQETPSYDGTFVSGQSRKEYFEQMSASIALSGAYEGFSGEVSGSFSNKVLTNTNNVFATSNVIQAYYRLSLTDRAKLLPQVAEHIATMEPQTLFDRYGTHYLKSLYIGARVSFTSHADITKVSKDFEMSAAVRAAYAEVVKGEATGGSVSKEDREQVANNKHIRVMGGDPAKANAIVDGSGEPAENYRAWSESVPNFVSIADFGKGGLVPLYELASTPERRSELEAAWGPYMQARTNTVLTEEDPEPVMVKKNSRFKLRSRDDRYITSSESATRYYYARLGQSPQIMKFGGGDRPLVSGSVVHIKTTEKWQGKWKPRTLLGAFGDATELYYWSDYGSKSNWIIEKTDPGQEGAQVYYGDQVYIRNEAYDDQYLFPYKNNYLSTKKLELHPWTIEPE